MDVKEKIASKRERAELIDAIYDALGADGTKSVHNIVSALTIVLEDVVQMMVRDMEEEK